MANRNYVNYRIQQLQAEIPALKKKVVHARTQLDHLDLEIDKLSTKLDAVITGTDSFLSSIEKQHETKIRQMQERIDRLQAKLSKSGVSTGTNDVPNTVVLEKAKTIAIFDSILNNITFWSDSGDLASDVEAASQSVIFPVVYERVMAGTDPAYLLDDVPHSAAIVVKQGREFVQWVRSECFSHITDPKAWEEFSPKIQEWWLRVGLPLIYGESDPEWESDTFYTLDQIETWRNNQADRMIAFPRIFDAMEIYSKNRKEVMETTRILQFTREMAEQRLP